MADSPYYALIDHGVERIWVKDDDVSVLFDLEPYEPISQIHPTIMNSTCKAEIDLYTYTYGLICGLLGKEYPAIREQYISFVRSYLARCAKHNNGKIRYEDYWCVYDQTTFGLIYVAAKASGVFDLHKDIPRAFNYVCKLYYESDMFNHLMYEVIYELPAKNREQHNIRKRGLERLIHSKDLSTTELMDKYLCLHSNKDNKLVKNFSQFSEGAFMVFEQQPEFMCLFKSI